MLSEMNILLKDVPYGTKGTESPLIISILIPNLIMEKKLIIPIYFLNVFISGINTDQIKFQTYPKATYTLSH